MRTAYLVAPEADAADAVQEGFIKAYAALSRFREDAPFRPWLLRIVANEARNRRRSAARRSGLALRAAATDPTPGLAAVARIRGSGGGDTHGSSTRHSPGCGTRIAR